MFLNHELPDYTQVLRSADGRGARVNERWLTSSFLLSPNQLQEAWAVDSAAALSAEDLAPLLALNPELVLLGTGDKQVFPPAAVLATCLTRGIGIEVMNNSAAARTFNVLASEGRKVAAGFIIPPAA